MCLSIPARVESIDGEMAVVNVGGVRYNASLQMVEDVGIGDFVLLHTGFAIQKLSEEEAKETLELFKEFEELNDQLDREENETAK